MPNQTELMERARTSAINEIGRMYFARDLADCAIRDGWPVDEFKRALYVSQTETARPPTEVGLSASEVTQYSLLRQISALGLVPGPPRESLEMEAHRAIAKQIGDPQNDHVFYVPLEIQRRDLSAAVANAGGFLVGRPHDGSFIGVLRNRSVAFRMGATRLSGLKGNLPIPRQSSPSGAVWLANETQQATPSDAGFGDITLTPKIVSGFTRISRQLAMQSSPAAEAIVTSDLGSTVSVAADLGALDGSGASGQPLGIRNTPGVGSVTGTSLSKAGINDFQTDLLDSNAVLNPSALGFVTTPAVASILNQRVAFTGTASPLWAGPLHDGQIDGIRAMSTKQVPAGTMIYGDWSELLIGEWGVLAIEVDPFTVFQTFKIGVRAMYTIDIAVRHATSFSVAISIT